MTTSQRQLEEDAIRTIQTYLRHLSFHNEQIAPLPIDGIFESATRDALLAFQEMQGLPTTGIADNITWDLLKQEYDRSVALNSPPATPQLFPRFPRDYRITEGDTGFLVDTVRHMLSELEEVYHFPDYPPAAGFACNQPYDSDTIRAVKSFQRRNRIAPTGEIDRETWDAITLQFNLLQ